MAEEQMQAASAEPANEPATQTPSATDTGITQNNASVQSTESATNQQPVASDQTKQAPADVPEDFVWDGNVEALPQSLQTRGKGMLRYMHKVTQEAAQVKHLAQAYNELINNPALQEYLNQYQQKPAQAQEQQIPSVSEDDIRSAVLEADPKKLDNVLQAYVAKTVNPIAQQALQRIQQLEQQLATRDALNEIDAFAQVHPDFYDIPQEVMKAAFQEVQVGRKGTVLDAYNKAKEIEKQYYEKASKTINQKVAEKKTAVSAPPSRSVNPDIIYVDTPAERNRIAFEHAANGKTVDVRVRRK